MISGRFNAAACVLIIAAFVILVWKFFLRRNHGRFVEAPEDPFSLEYLMKQTSKMINQTLRTRVEDLHLNKVETEKQRHNKTQLRNNLRLCRGGDEGAKAYIKDYIASILQCDLGVNEGTIENIIRFGNPEEMMCDDKFEIILRYYERSCGRLALECLLRDNGFDHLREGRYEVTREDIDRLYRKLETELELSYYDKLEVVVQRMYQLLYGHGCVDKLRDMAVDGVSVGVSGIPEDMFNYTGELLNGAAKQARAFNFSYDSVWVFFHGKSIRLGCIGCHSQKELIRVCKNLYSYKAPHQLSENNSRVENDMRDGSRVVVGRPKFSDSWFAIVRKHSQGILMPLEEQIKDKGAEYVSGVAGALIHGEQVFAITGGQGCGKTTLLRGLIRFVRTWHNLRIEELIFELELRRAYPDHNILTFKELPGISIQDGLEFQMKTDGDVNIFGEVVKRVVAAYIIRISQTTLYTFFTHHAKTTDALLRWFRNALLEENGFSSEDVAMEEVINCLSFDIHMASDDTGRRYVERMTEVIPGTDGLRRGGYRLNTFLVYDKNKRQYRLVNRISPRKEKEMLSHMHGEEQAAFMKLFSGVSYREPSEAGMTGVA